MSDRPAPLVVIDIVGLTPRLLGEHTPNLNRLISSGEMRPVEGVFPAVTTSAQASMMTGRYPDEHGIVGNGWYWRDLAEIKFWLQPDRLVQSQKVWERFKDRYSDFRCSRLFWWNNMYSRVDYSVTPRPHYHADGRKEVGLYSNPADLHLRLEASLGQFPFFNFWGPKSDIRSSQWIAQAAALEFEWHRPDLQFVYLPHLDYNLQRLGPENPEIARDVAEIDRVAGELIDRVISLGAAVLVVSEYGITSVSRPISINRILREHGYVSVRESSTWELLDAGASRAFAVADHQVAHVYVRRAGDVSAVRELLESTPGIDEVLADELQRERRIRHERAGELLAIAERDAWFTYYYWFDEGKAPDFARTVDIHRKPGYDPLELFLDPGLRWPRLHIIRRLAQKAIGMRMLMDVIPLDPNLVRGSHGRLPSRESDAPVLIHSQPGMLYDARSLVDVADIIERYFSHRGRQGALDGSQ